MNPQPLQSAPAPVLESLEQRLAPAGIITLSTAGGVLTITGDADANAIQILDIPETGQWQINNPAGQNTTFVLNGATIAAGTTIAPQNGIKANLGGGDDTFEFRSSVKISSLQLAGGVNLNMGAGNDQVKLGNFAGQELVTGALNVDLGDGDDTFSSTLGIVAQGVAKVAGGGGNDSVRFETTSSQVFLKGLTVDLGKGDNSLLVNSTSLAVTGALNVTDAGEAGKTPLIVLNMDSLQVDGSMKVATGAANATLQIGTQSSGLVQVTGGVNITTGNGIDTVNLAGVHLYGGALNIDLKDGTNLTTLAGDIKAGSLTIKGTNGNDAVELAASSSLAVNGAASLNLGNGSNEWRVQNGAALTTGSLAYAGGTGADTVSIFGDSLKVLGAMTLNTGPDGTGNVEMAVGDSFHVGGALTFTGGKALDSFSVTTPDLVVGGIFKAALGGGSNSLRLEGSGARLGGGFTYAGGTGDDVVNIVNQTLIMAKGMAFTGGGASNADSLILAADQGSVGSVSFVGSAASDEFVLGSLNGPQSELFTVNGNVSVNLGSGGNSATVQDAAVHGNLNVVSGSKAGENDLLIAKRTVVNGSFNAAMGAGESVVRMNDLLMRGATNLNTAGGADLVQIETDPSLTGNSNWFGTVKIVTGDGADAVTLGANNATFGLNNLFFRNVTVDGGTGFNTLVGDQGPVNTFQAGAQLITSGF